MPRRLTGLAILALSSVLACSSAEEPAGRQADEIVGGVGAKGRRLDAVGALGRVQADGSFKYYCTATLVAPRLVLTAKHCAARSGSPAYTESEAIHFAIGDDSKAPRRTVKVLRTWMAPLDEGGYIKRGSDVAIMSLEESVEDVAPMAIANGHAEASLAGERVSAVGFGVRDVARSSGLRRAGTLTIRATSGPIVQSVFSTADELVSFVKTEGGAAYDPSRDEERLRELWDKSLLEDHELFAGVAPGDAQPCSGDSGGPLVARIEGGLAVFAVVSGSFKLSNSSINPCSVIGEVYATFPADVQAMFDEAAAATEGGGPKRVSPKGILTGSSAAVPEDPDGGDRCAGVSTSGRCEDGAAIRCIADSEGPPRVTRTDCTLLMQTCGMVTPPEVDGGAPAPSAECVDR